MRCPKPCMHPQVSCIMIGRDQSRFFKGLDQHQQCIEIGCVEAVDSCKDFFARVQNVSPPIVIRAVI